MSIVDDAGRELISTPVSQVYCFQSTTKETVKVLDVKNSIWHAHDAHVASVKPGFIILVHCKLSSASCF